jgi:Flp pilus assembly protein TadD
VTVRPTFAAGTSEERAYQALLGLGISVSTINSGCHQVNYSSRADGGSPGSGDQKINACEAWSSFAVQAHRLPTDSTALFGSQPPWVFPTNPSPQLQRILTRIDNEITRLRTLHQSAPDADLRIARGLYNFIVSASPNALGILYTNSIQTNSAGQVLLGGDANCSESFSTIKAVFGRAGLNVDPVFVFLPGGNGNPHIATAFDFRGQTYLMDPSVNAFDASQLPSHSHRARISLREFWAWHFNDRAEMAADAGDIALAERFFAQARRLDPNNPHFPNNLGLRLDATGGRAADAESALRQAIQVDPQFIEPYVNLGALLVDQRRYQDALVPLAQGLTIDSHDQRILYNLALAHARLGHNSQALTYVERAIQQDSTDPDYFQLRADVLNRLGRYTEAHRALATVSRLSSGQ